MLTLGLRPLSGAMRTQRARASRLHRTKLRPLSGAMRTLITFLRARLDEELRPLSGAMRTGRPSSHLRQSASVATPLRGDEDPQGKGPGQ